MRDASSDGEGDGGSGGLYGTAGMSGGGPVSLLARPSPLPQPELAAVYGPPSTGTSTESTAAVGVTRVRVRACVAPLWQVAPVLVRTVLYLLDCVCWPTLFWFRVPTLF